ncbi:MAG: hypothetical protein FJZ01_16055 [Candidatus Sericytochromatia bacterium]|nr:hypothetical protein [Candidatus Tanganyikabacteria bacterium]
MVYDLPPVEVFTDRLAVCLDCLARRCRDLDDAKYVLTLYGELICKGTPVLDAWARMVPGFEQVHVDAVHQVAHAEFTLVTGRVRDPQVQPLLQEFGPLRVDGGGHFEHRPPLNPAIEAEAHLIGMDTTEEAVPANYRFYQGPRKIKNQPVPPERLISLMFRVPTKFHLPAIRNGIQRIVAVESGLPVLQGLLHKASRELDRLRAEAASGLGVEAHVPHRLAWYILERYLALAGNGELLAAINRKWPGILPGLSAALEGLDLPLQEQVVIEGDVLVLGYLVDKTALYLPGIRNIGNLFSHLGRLGYPRLAATDNRQQHRAILKICKDMATPLERARVVTIDWSPVMGALKG